MKVLRTSDERFENLPDFSFEPHYVEVDGIRIHYLDEGPEKGEIVLLMHGEPTWCFLYRHMIPPLVKAGFRCFAPDLVGFGRSDKPTEQSDHTYARHVKWMTEWMKKIDLRDITMFCQDWGSLIGLRLAIENQERFSRIILANGGLPTGDIPEQFLEAMAPFLRWRAASKYLYIAKRYSQFNYILNFSIRHIMQWGTYNNLSEDIIAAYEAPFPDDSYIAATRIMPQLVPISDDNPETPVNKIAFAEYQKWEKPFLTAFSNKDPITRGGYMPWQGIPGAKGQKHKTIRKASHFLQEEKGPELAEVIMQFIKDNP